MDVANSYLEADDGAAAPRSRPRMTATYRSALRELSFGNQVLPGLQLVTALLDERPEMRQVANLLMQCAGSLQVANPVQEFGQSWLLAKVKLPQSQQHVDGFTAQCHIRDPVQGEDVVKHLVIAWELDVVEDASAQECGRKGLLLIVRYYDDWPQLRVVARHREPKSRYLGDVEGKLVKLME